jgi:hypothetical protein
MAHVLVAQDDPTMQALLRELLEEEGHAVTAVSNGWDMLITMRSCLHPLVVVYYERLLYGSSAVHGRVQDNSEQVWQACARHVDDLRRHRFVETRSSASPAAPTVQPLYDQLGIVMIALPFELEPFLSSINEMARQIA